MTYSQIIWDVRRKLLELTAGIISDETLYLRINQAQDELAEEFLPRELLTSASFPFVSGVYTPAEDPVGSGLYPDLVDDFITFAQCNDYTWLSADEFLQNLDDQSLTKVMTKIGSDIKIYPADTTTLTVYYYKYPVKLTDSITGNEPGLPRGLHESIIMGAKWRALEDLQETELATAARIEAEQIKKNRGAAVSKNEEKNRAGTPMFTSLDLNLGGSSFVPNKLRF
jgi:hypothetical protein